VQNEIEEPRKRWVEEYGMKLRRANPGSGAPMGLRSAYPRGGAPKRGGGRSVECTIGAPEGIEELPSRA